MPLIAEHSSIDLKPFDPSSFATAALHSLHTRPAAQKKKSGGRGVRCVADSFDRGPARHRRCGGTASGSASVGAERPCASASRRFKGIVFVTASAWEASEASRDGFGEQHHSTPMRRSSCARRFKADAARVVRSIREGAASARRVMISAGSRRCRTIAPSEATDELTITIGRRTTFPERQTSRTRRLGEQGPVPYKNR